MTDHSDDPREKGSPQPREGESSKPIESRDTDAAPSAPPPVALPAASPYAASTPPMQPTAVVTGSADNWFLYQVQPTLTVTGTDTTVTYDGTSQTLGGFTVTGLVNGDSQAQALTTDPALIGQVDAATYTVGTLSGGASEIGYAIALQAGTLTIDPRALTVTADPGQSKLASEPDPTFTFTLTGGSLVAGDAFGGALARLLGEAPDDYGLLIGTLTAGANYDIDFVANPFTILELVSQTLDFPLEALPTTSFFLGGPPTNLPNGSADTSPLPGGFGLPPTLVECARGGFAGAGCGALLDRLTFGDL